MRIFLPLEAAHSIFISLGLFLKIYYYYYYYYYLAVPRSLWNLSSPTRDQTVPSAVKVLSPNHCTAREFPLCLLESYFLSSLVHWFQVLVSILRHIYLHYVMTPSISNSKTLSWASIFFRLIISSFSASDTLVLIPLRSFLCPCILSCLYSFKNKFPERLCTALGVLILKLIEPFWWLHPSHKPC